MCQDVALEGTFLVAGVFTLVAAERLFPSMNTLMNFQGFFLGKCRAAKIAFKRLQACVSFLVSMEITVVVGFISAVFAFIGILLLSSGSSNI